MSARGTVRWLSALIMACTAYTNNAAANEPSPSHGQQLFTLWCAPCHARVSGQEQLPGTTTLQNLYRGSKPAALEDRTDLTPELVTVYVRHGINAMPWFRKTELSDADVAAIGAYLARNTPAAR